MFYVKRECVYFQLSKKLDKCDSLKRPTKVDYTGSSGSADTTVILRGLAWLRRGSSTARVTSLKMERRRRRMLLLRTLGSSGHSSGSHQAFMRKSSSMFTFSKVPVSSETSTVTVKCS